MHDVGVNKRGPSRGKGDPRAPAPNLHRDKSRSHPDEERDRTPAPNLHRDKVDHDCADDHRAGNRDAIGAAARPLIDVESGRIARIGIAYVKQHLVHGPDRTDDLLLEGARQVGGALTCCVNCLGPLRAKVVERTHPDEECDRSAKRDRGIGSYV